VPDVTQLLDSAFSGDPQAAEELLPLIYDQLRKIAASKMAREQPGQTLQATALVHEAWMRLSKNNSQWDNRRHFFSAAAEAMRRILIERARRKQSQREAGVSSLDELSESRIVVLAKPEELLAVHEALDAFADEEPEGAELVKLRYFVGMTMPQAAESMGKSLRATERLWTFSKTWLRHAIDSK
jgi:RNA polymerase sigma factor (TIGR02999 family)